MWPCSTRVYARFSSAGGGIEPNRSVRVMSVVPSTYWPPESTNSSVEGVTAAGPGEPRPNEEEACAGEMKT